jgi:hypothetical protein
VAREADGSRGLGVGGRRPPSAAWRDRDGERGTWGLLLNWFESRSRGAGSAKRDGDGTDEPGPRGSRHATGAGVGDPSMVAAVRPLDLGKIHTRSLLFHIVSGFKHV